MRAKRLSIAIAIALIALAAYIFWPDSAPVSDTGMPEPPRATVINQPADVPAPSSPTAEPSSGERFINGISLSNKGRPLANTEILHRIIDISPQQSCVALNAELELSNQTAFIVSDERGRFSLPYSDKANASNTPRCLMISASKTGYATSTVALPLNLERLPDQIEIELTPSSFLRGKVINPNNDPAVAAKVAAWQPAENSAEPPCMSDAPEAPIVSKTTAAGEFTLELSQGTDYCVQALHGNWSRSDVQLIALDDSIRELRLQLGQRQTLTGIVVDLDQRPLPNLTLQLQNPHKGPLLENLTATTDANGEVIFNQVDRGTYTLTVLEPGYRIAEPTTVSTTTTQPADQLQITVFPVTVISGQVLAPSGQPLAGVNVSARSPYAGEQSFSQTNTNRNGYFELISLHQSPAAYEHFKMASAFVEQVRGRPEFMGAVCVEFYHPHYQGLTKSVSITEASLDLGVTQLQSSALEITGRVINHRDEPTPATLVFTHRAEDESQPLEVRLPQCGDLQTVRHVATNEQGEFTASLDDPGRYEIEVITDKYKKRTFERTYYNATSGVEIKIE